MYDLSENAVFMACIVFKRSLEGDGFSEARDTKMRRGKIIRKDAATKNIATPQPLYQLEWWRLELLQTYQQKRRLFPDLK